MASLMKYDDAVRVRDAELLERTIAPDQAHNALAVFVVDERLRPVLEEIDPKAMEQARGTLGLDAEERSSLDRERSAALPCIRCGKQLYQVSKEAPVTESFQNQPYNGTAFYTSGHYGSTVFDEVFGETIEINVCDTCLLDAAKEQRILYYRRVTQTEYVDRQFWTPDEENEEYVRKTDEREHGS